MAEKKGLAFYRLDTDKYQDKRIKRLKKEFKRDGVAVYDYLLCEIYRDKGCFLLWDEGTTFDVADYWDLKESTVNEIVNYCCAVGLFNKRLFTSERVLTSSSIQNRYLEICKLMKRTGKLIPEEYVIIPEESTKSPELSQNTPEEIDREEKSKEEEIRENRANALVVAKAPTEVDQQNLKSEYKKLVSTLSGSDLRTVVTGLKEFLSSKKPLFIEPYQDYWNIFADRYSLPKAATINDVRKKKFKTRINESAFDFVKIMEKVNTSNTLKGVDSNTSWKVNFDWILENQSNYVKILEGNYNGN